MEKRTVLNMLKLAGENCERLLTERVRNVPVQDVQADEIWTFVQKKDRRAVEWTLLPSTGQLENHSHLLDWEPCIFTERLLLGFRESLAARLTLPALDLVLAVKSGLDHLDSAIVAPHLDLAFFGRKRQNDSGCNNPAFGASPRLGPASGSSHKRGRTI